MTTILIVDDDPDWQELLPRALAGYQVAVAGTYEAALTLLAEGMSYEVAIVDVNLVYLQQEQRTTGIPGDDGLGVGILRVLRDSYPNTRRIACTGLPAEAVDGVIEQYGLDSLLHKKELSSLKEVRAATEASLQRAWTDIPAAVWNAKSELGVRFSGWRKERAEHFQVVAKLLGEEIHEARSIGQPTKHLLQELTDLNKGVEKFGAECPAYVQMLTAARSGEDVQQASLEFDRLRKVYGTGGDG
jgi:CheY-like chemotaxis protein